MKVELRRVGLMMGEKIWNIYMTVALSETMLDHLY